MCRGRGRADGVYGGGKAGWGEEGLGGGLWKTARLGRERKGYELWRGRRLDGERERRRGEEGCGFGGEKWCEGQCVFQSLTGVEALDEEIRRGE